MSLVITHAQAIELLRNHKGADTPDIKPVLSEGGMLSWDEKTHDYALSLGLDIRAILTAPQKQVKRAAQLINCVRVGVVSELDYTHTRVLIAMRAAGDYDLNTDALAALAANAIRPGVDTRGVTRGQVNTMFKRSHSLETVKTKISNSVGVNGYMTITGMVTRKGKQIKCAVIKRNPTHPLALAFYSMIDTATLGQLQALADKGEKVK